MNKLFLPLGVVALVAGMVALGAVLSRQSEGPSGQVLSSDITDADHRKGNVDAKVQLIEYGDMQCPACASFEPIIEQVMANNSDWVQFAYRHFPLKSIHPNAEEGSYAVEAAHLQGKFWEMKKLIYERQSEWSAMPDPAGKFLEYAVSLGLDADRFQADYYSDAVKVEVESDYRTGNEAGFNSTPTFVINGEKVSSPPNYDKFVELLRQAQAE